MNPRSLLALALVVAGLGAFIWLYERDLPSTDERRETQGRVVPFAAEEIRYLEIGQTGSGESLRLERRSEDDPWRLVSPFEYLADGEAVEEFVERLAGLKKERTVEQTDFSSLGLDPALAVLTVGTGDRELGLKFGAAVPASNNRLVAALSAATVWVTSNAVDEDLERRAGEWRSRRILPGDADTILTLSLRGPSGGFTMARVEDEWRLTAPFDDATEPDRVEDLLRLLGELRVRKFADELPAGLVVLEAATFDLPRLGIGAEFEDGRSWSLEVGTKIVEGGVLVRTAAEGFALEPVGLDELHLDAADLQRLRFTAFDGYLIEQAVFTMGEERMELGRDGGGWLLDGAPVEYAPAAAVINALSGLTAERLVLAGKGPSGGRDRKPALTIEVAAGDSTEVLTLFDGSEGGFVGTSSDRSFDAVLSAAAVEALQQKLLALEPIPPVDAGETLPGDNPQGVDHPG